VPEGDPAIIFERALALLVTQLERRKTRRGRSRLVPERVDAEVGSALRLLLVREIRMLAHDNALAGEIP
jgi:hypothetical protein